MARSTFCIHTRQRKGKKYIVIQLSTLDNKRGVQSVLLTLLIIIYISFQNKRERFYFNSKERKDWIISWLLNRFLGFRVLSAALPVFLQKN
jgi:hypothetical protein